MEVKQIPRGDTEQEDAIVGYPGQLRGDMSRGDVRFHDGVRQGGHRLLNEEGVRSLIASGLEQAGTGTIQFFSSNALLAASAPNPTVLAIVMAAGFEEHYIWSPNADVAGDGIVSDIDGHWKRVNNKVGFYIRLRQAGLISMQINGVEPAVSQDTTAWLDNGTVKLYDGADYLSATPVLFARLLAKVGNYNVGAFSLPDRIAATAVEIADCDLVEESGWFKTAAAAANAPIAGVHVLQHYRISSTIEMQIVHTQGSATLTKHVRWKNTTWGSWISVDDVLPTRLAATSGNVANADTAVESGFYQLTAAASNIPAAEKGTIQVVRYSSTAVTQLWKSTDSNKFYTRQMLASAWSAWAEVGAAMTLSALTTLMQTASADAAMLAADGFWYYDSVDLVMKKLTLTELIAVLDDSFPLLGLLTTRGDIIYRDAAGWQRLAKGTAGQLLTQGADDPGWADANAGGLTYLGGIATTTGSSRSVSGLDLTGYKRIWVDFVGVSMNQTGQVRFNSISLVSTNIGDTSTFSGRFDINLSSELALVIGSWASQAVGMEAGKYVDFNINNASTTITFSVSAGSLDAGRFDVWGVK